MQKLLVVMAQCYEAPYISPKYENLFHFTGIGKVNAGIHTLELIRMYEPDLIINFGTAGSMKSHLSGLVECGVFVSKENTFGEHQVVVFDENKAKIASTSSFALERDESYDLIDMESYSIAYLCKRYGVDFKCYKYITDYPGMNSLRDWEEIVGDGNDHYMKVLDDYFKNSI